MSKMFMWSCNAFSSNCKLLIKKDSYLAIVTETNNIAEYSVFETDFKGTVYNKKRLLAVEKAKQLVELFISNHPELIEKLYDTDNYWNNLNLDK